MKGLKPIIAITYACLAGTLILILPAYQEGVLQNFMQYSVEVWLSVFALGFLGTALAFTWFYEGIDKIGPSRAGIFINFVPIFATLMAVLILHEKLSPSLVIGAIFVVSGVYLTNYQAKNIQIEKVKEINVGVR
jgi:drug/metabolite transporter (DMT)-like permease